MSVIGVANEYGTFTVSLAGLHVSTTYVSADYTVEDESGTYVYLGDCEPTIVANPKCADGPTSVDVTGTDFVLGGADRIDITVYDGDAGIAGDSIAPTESWTTSITFDGALADGLYEIRAQSIEGDFVVAEASTWLLVPCPTITVTPDCAMAGGPPDTVALTVEVTNNLIYTSALGNSNVDFVVFAGSSPFLDDADAQDFTTDALDIGYFEIRPYLRTAGVYTVLMKQGYTDGGDGSTGTNREWYSVTTTFTVPCGQPDPIVYITPDCVNVTGSGDYVELRIHGRNFTPDSNVRIVDELWDAQFSEPAIRSAIVSPYGTFNYVVGSDSNDSIWFEPEDPPHKISVSYEEDGHSNTVVAFTYIGNCGAQIEVAPLCGPAGTDSLRVIGSGWNDFYQDIQVSVTGDGYDFAFEVPASQSFDVVQPLDVPLDDGVYTITAAQFAFEGDPPFGIFALTYFLVPCPTITITPDCAPEGGPPDTMSLTVTTSGFLELDDPDWIEIVFDAPVTAAEEPEHESQEWVFTGAANGEFVITPYARPEGVYRVVAKQGYDHGNSTFTGWTHRLWTYAEVEFEVSCAESTDPILYVSPDCVTNGEPTEIRVHGRNFDRNREVDVWDVFNENSVTVTTSNFGTFDVELPFTLDFDGYSSIEAFYSDDDSFTTLAYVTVTLCVAQIELTLKCGSGVTSIEVNGSGFQTGPDYFIALYVYDLADDDLISQAEIVASETFTASVEFDGDSYPGGLPDGQYAVYAELTSESESVFEYAQTFFLAPCPTVSVEPVCAPPGGPPNEMTLLVTTTGFLEFDPFTGPDLPNKIEIVFDNPATPADEPLHEPQEWVIAGAPINDTFTITPFFRPDGVYRITAKQGYDTGTSNGGALTHRVWTYAEVTFTVPCPGPAPLDPLLYVTPDCLSSEGPTNIQIHGRNFAPNTDVQVFDLVTQVGTSALTNEYGTFDLELEIDHLDGGYHYIVASYDGESEVAYVVLADCPAAITATPRCGTELTSITVSGTDWFAETGSIVIEMYEIDTFTLITSTSIEPEPTFEVELSFDGSPLPDGQYVILAEQDDGETTLSARTFVVLPCPTITIEPVCGPAGGPPDTYSIMVTASGFVQFQGLDRLEIVFDVGGSPQEFWAPASNGTFEITPYERPNGGYTISAKQGYERGSVFAGIALFIQPGATNRQWTEASTFFAVPCLPEVIDIFISVDCGPPAVEGEEGFYEITVNGFGWLPGGVDVYFDVDEVAGPADAFAFDVNSEGTFSGLITPAHRPLGTYRIMAQQFYFDQPVFASAFFTVPCIVIDPVMELDPQCGPPQLVGDEDRNYELTLTGSGYAPGSVLIIFDADGPELDQQIFESSVDDLGNFVATITPLFMPEGEYRIAGRQDVVESDPIESSVIFFVPCAPALPELAIDPACGPVVIGDEAAEPSYEINVSGTAFFPGPVDIYFDFSGELELFSAAADEDGAFETVITPTGRTAGIYDIVAQQEVAFSGTVVEGAAIFVVDCEGPQMRVVPGSGPRGLVVRVEGFNFPAETALDLRWDRGIGAGRAIPTLTDATGTFVRYILIFRSDFTGLRNLTPALPEDVEAFPGVTARYLVVVGTIQPPFETDNPFALPETIIRTRR